jgi:Winged helix DNA-binding domain
MSVPDVLTDRQLNRALLARQHLLQRTPMAPLAMVEHLVAMQAQNPLDPYLALWSRLAGFDPAELSGAIAAAQAARLGLLRTTLHLVTTQDAVRLWPLVQPVLARAWSSSPFRKDLAGVDVEEVLAHSVPFLAEPRSNAELGAWLAERWPDRPPASLAYAARFLLPIVQVPPRGLWGRTGRPRWQLLEAWRAPDTMADPTSTVDALVLRYLAAFGPATAGDVATWSWLTGIREVLARLRPRLRAFRDEAGRELFDLPDAPLPHPDTPAPVRFLPEFDNVALSHADRSRIIHPLAVGRLTGWVGSLLVDGLVAGQWRLDIVPREGRATLVLDPFIELTAAQREDAFAEGAALLAFRAPEAEPTEIVFGPARAAAGSAPAVPPGHS